MTEIRVWIIEQGDEFWVMKNSNPGDERPARLLRKCSSRGDAEVQVRLLWSNLL